MKATALPGAPKRRRQAAVRRTGVAPKEPGPTPAGSQTGAASSFTAQAAAQPPLSSALPDAQPRGFPSRARAWGEDAGSIGDLDRYLHATLGRLTFGLSPAALALAFADWATHLALSPAKQFELAGDAVGKWARLAGFLPHAVRGEADRRAIDPLPQDRRFRAPAWQQFPFNVVHQAFLLEQAWLHNATTGVRGVSRHHEEVVNFVTRQMLDVWSPSNSAWLNPEVWHAAVASGGFNFVRGANHALDDAMRAASGAPPRGAEAFRPGREVATTPGKVVYRNRLFELLQYDPVTPEVRPEPVLIVPAWIMKYYILDLSPSNSLIGWLVRQGFTVFAVSWRNPDAADRDLGMDDYLERGLMTALSAVGAVVPGRRVHAVGYCLGGTLLAIAAAAMARENDSRLATITLLAAQTDFTAPGELGLFIDDSQLAFLDDSMWTQGYLDSTQMAGAFQLLRSNDLVWSRVVRHYMMGEDDTLNDLMAWNADATRMPYRMHGEYLRQLFLDNELAEGRYKVGGRPVALGDVAQPMFVVGTVFDHVAPWRSVYRIHVLTDNDLTFALVTGGHNAGIVSEPGRDGRGYRLATRPKDGKYVDADGYLASATSYPGSWWPAWAEWLHARSGEPVAPPPTGAAHAGCTVLGDAPGTYVFQK